MASNPLYNHSLVNLYRSIGSQMGFSPAFQNASAAQGISESSLNPNAVGDSGASFGLHQWNRKASPERYQALLNVSQQMGLPPTDPRVQITHWYNENKANKGITDPRVANDAALASERPAGWKPGDPTGVPSYNKRLGDTMALMRLVNGQQPSDNSWQATGTDDMANAAMQPPGAQAISLGSDEQQPFNNIGSTLANMGASIASLDNRGTGIASLNASRVASNLTAQEAARERENGWKYAGQTQNGQGLVFQNSRGEIRVEPLNSQFAGQREPEQVRTLRAIAADPELTKTYSSMHGGGATLSTEAIKNAAARVKNGEKGVLTRMSQGNAAAIAEEVAAQTGEDPGQILQNQINATGKQAEARTIGTSVGKSAVSAGTFASGVANALDASKKVGRGEFVPINQIEQMLKKNASDPAVLDFKASHETMIREYAKAINPNGNPTVSDMNHARELLSTATDEPAYERVVARLQSEIANKQKNLEKLNSNKSDSGSSTKEFTWNPKTGKIE